LPFEDGEGGSREYTQKNTAHGYEGTQGGPKVLRLGGGGGCVDERADPYFYVVRNVRSESRTGGEGGSWHKGRTIKLSGKKIRLNGV